MKRLILCMVPALLLSSCLFDRDYVYDDELDMYVERFLSYADAYGYDFRDEDHEISVRFTDLDGEKAGVCYMNTHHPIKFEFDSAYWRQISGNTNSDRLKENLVFHELGHGLLRRTHDNTVLYNDDWKTIMCGDELPDDRTPNINYRGMRRDYYIRELFDRHTPAPKWSSYEPDFSNQPLEAVYEAKLTDETSPYTSGTTDLFQTVSDARGFSITNRTRDDALYAIHFTDFYSEDDFLLEITLTSNADEYGVVFGQCDKSKGHFTYLDNKKHCFIGEMSCKFPFIDLYKPDIASTANKIGVRHHNDTLFYYLNDQYFYLNDLTDLPKGGGYICMPIMARSTTTIKALKLYRDADSKRRTADMACTIEALPCQPLRKTPHDR